MWITLYTDASGNGGWAIWARAEIEPYRITRSGKCPPGDSTVVELIGILEGIKAVKQAWRDVEGIGVRCDSQAALKIAKFNAKPPRRNDLKKLQKEIKEALGGTKIKCIWVKGHQEGNHTQAYLNNWCDSNSRK